MNEAITRKEIIDIQLKQAGWNVNDQTEVIIEFDMNVSLYDGINEPPAGASMF